MNTDLVLDGRLESIEAIKKYIFGGKAIISIRSKKTDNRFTYKISKEPFSRYTNPIKFTVSLLTGPNNNRDYHLVGFIWLNPETKKSKFTIHRYATFNLEEKTSRKAFAWMHERLAAGRMDSLDQAEVWHEGICSRCGRRLTVPESIASGLGPECAKRMM